MKKVLVSLTDVNKRFYQRIPDKKRSKVFNECLDKLRTQIEQELANELLQTYENPKILVEEKIWDSIAPLNNKEYGWGNS